MAWWKQRPAPLRKLKAIKQCNLIVTHVKNITQMNLKMYQLKYESLRTWRNNTSRLTFTQLLPNNFTDFCDSFIVFHRKNIGWGWFVGNCPELCLLGLRTNANCEENYPPFPCSFCSCQHFILWLPICQNHSDFCNAIRTSLSQGEEFIVGKLDSLPCVCVPTHVFYGLHGLDEVTAWEMFPQWYMQEGVIAILYHPNLGELLTDVEAHGDIY